MSTRQGLRPLLLAAQGMGVRTRLVLDELGLSGPALDDPYGRITLAQEGAFWDAMIDLTGNPAVVIEMMNHLPLGSIPLFDFGGSSLASLIDALDTLESGVRVLHLLWMSQVFRERDAVRYRVTCSHALPPSAHRTVEFHFALVMSRFRQWAGLPIPLTAVRFAHPRVGESGPYADYFGVDVVFDAPHDELVYDASFAEIEAANADRMVASGLVGTLSQMLAEFDRLDRADPRIVHRVRQELQVRLQEEAPTEIEPVARKLGFSTRSLQRQLGAADTSFRLMLDQARRARWRTLLLEQVDDHEMAYRLGYSEAKAFRRARKRWEADTADLSSRADE